MMVICKIFSDHTAVVPLAGLSTVSSDTVIPVISPNAAVSLLTLSGSSVATSRPSTSASAVLTANTASTSAQSGVCPSRVIVS